MNPGNQPKGVMYHVIFFLINVPAYGISRSMAWKVGGQEGDGTQSVLIL